MMTKKHCSVYAKVTHAMALAPFPLPSPLGVHILSLCKAVLVTLAGSEHEIHDLCFFPWLHDEIVL